MKTNKWFSLILCLSAIGLMGQSCSIKIGGTTGQDGGVFRSDDHGVTWRQKNFVSQTKKQTVLLDNVSGRALVFDPRDSNHLYLGTLANGIWETKNSGDTWQATSLKSGNYECIDFDPLNSKVMYTASGSVVLKSTDGGQTWSTIYTESQPNQLVNCVAVDRLDSRYIWATTSGGKILLSDNYGEKWTLKHVFDPLQPRIIYMDRQQSGKLVIFSRGNGIYRTTDFGTNWTDLSKPLSAFTGAIDIRAVDVAPNAWYIAGAYGLLTSTDSGQTWKPISTLVVPTSVPVQNVAVNPKNTQEIFVTTDQKLHHTVNGGSTWDVTVLPTTRLPILMTFNPTNPDTLYFSTFKIKK